MQLTHTEHEALWDRLHDAGITDAELEYDPVEFWIILREDTHRAKAILQAMEPAQVGAQIVAHHLLTADPLLHIVTRWLNLCRPEPYHVGQTPPTLQHNRQWIGWYGTKVVTRGQPSEAAVMQELTRHHAAREALVRAAAERYLAALQQARRARPA